MATVFASSVLATLFADQSVSGKPSRAAAAVFSWSNDDPASGDYPGLGLKGGWNCLYLSRSGASVRASMVPVDNDASCMGAPIGSGTPLDVVVRLPESGMTADDIAPGARWGWAKGIDGPTNTVVIRCGSATCEVGPKGFTAEVDLPAEVQAAVLTATGNLRDARRVVQMQGWYDQQLLAEPDGAGGLKVGSVLATLVPAPRLGALNNDSDFDDWQQVAFAYFPDASVTYRDKLNFERGLNVISLRHGPMQEALPVGALPVRACKGDNSADPWWARVESASGAVKFYCANRWEHEELGDAIPGTVRWRWLDDDEGTWYRCPKGCCPTS